MVSRGFAYATRLGEKVEFLLEYATTISHTDAIYNRPLYLAFIIIPQS